ncbi:MAG: helix-turn-helix domain-containing protein [Candidatus Puniceispirillaceae bacterium]
MSDISATKIMIGHKLRKLRKELGISQAAMADELAISASYLNLLENNMRPVTVQLLFRLGQTYDIDLKDMAEDESASLTARLIEIFADPILSDQSLSRRDIQQLAQNQPGAATAILALYDNYETMKSAAQQDKDGSETRALPRPIEHVRRFLEQQENHFPTLEDAAEACAKKAQLQTGQYFSGLCRFLSEHHAIRVRIMPSHVMGHYVRHLDMHRQQLLLSEILEDSQRVFQLASQLALIAYQRDITTIIETSGLEDLETRQLLQTTLAGYFAGALMMPYQSFLKSAQETRHDFDLLGKRYSASFEQICHRLTTMNNPSARGIPFFFLRVDEAGYISKRLSAAGIEFARHGGACGRWIPHQAFRVPGALHSQLAEMEEGQKFFTLARTVEQPRTGPAHHGTALFAVALGCELKHAKDIGLADGLLSPKQPSFTPIGLACQLCERPQCGHRGAPPVGRSLKFDPHRRQSGLFDFGS